MISTTKRQKLANQATIGHQKGSPGRKSQSCLSSSRQHSQESRRKCQSTLVSKLSTQKLEPVRANHRQPAGQRQKLHSTTGQLGHPGSAAAQKQKFITRSSEKLATPVPTVNSLHSVLNAPQAENTFAQRQDDVLKDFTDQSLQWKNCSALASFQSDKNCKLQQVIAASKTPDVKTSRLISQVKKKKQFVPVLLTSSRRSQKTVSPISKCPKSTFISKTSRTTPQKLSKGGLSTQDRLRCSSLEKMSPSKNASSACHSPHLLKSKQQHYREKQLNLAVSSQEKNENTQAALKSMKSLIQLSQSKQTCHQSSIGSQLDKVSIKFQTNALRMKRPQALHTCIQQQQQASGKSSGNRKIQSPVPRKTFQHSALASPSQLTLPGRKRSSTPSSTKSYFSRTVAPESHLYQSQRLKLGEQHSIIVKTMQNNLVAHVPRKKLNNGDLAAVLQPELDMQKSTVKVDSPVFCVKAEDSIHEQSSLHSKLSEQTSQRPQAEQREHTPPRKLVALALNDDRYFTSIETVEKIDPSGSHKASFSKDRSFKSIESVESDLSDTDELVKTIEYIQDCDGVEAGDEDEESVKQPIGAESYREKASHSQYFKDQDDEHQYAFEQCPEHDDQELITVEQDEAEPSESRNDSDSIFALGEEDLLTEPCLPEQEYSEIDKSSRASSRSELPHPVSGKKLRLNFSMAAYLRPTISSQIKKDISLVNLMKRDRTQYFHTSSNSSLAHASSSEKMLFCTDEQPTQDRDMKQVQTARMNQKLQGQSAPYNLVSPEKAASSGSKEERRSALKKHNNRYYQRFLTKLPRSDETTKAGKIKNIGSAPGNEQQLSSSEQVVPSFNCNNNNVNYKQQISYFTDLVRTQKIQKGDIENEAYSHPPHDREPSLSKSNSPTSPQDEMRHHHQTSQVRNLPGNQSLNHHRAILHNMIMSQQNHHHLPQSKQPQPLNSNAVASAFAEKSALQTAIDQHASTGLSKSAKYGTHAQQLPSNHTSNKQSIDSCATSQNQNGQSGAAPGNRLTKNSKPSFVPTVTNQNAGRLISSYGGASIAEGVFDRHLHAHHKTADANSDSSAIGKEQLQEILTEVASIEKKYSNQPNGSSLSRQSNQMQDTRVQQQDTSGPFGAELGNNQAHPNITFDDDEKSAIVDNNPKKTKSGDLQAMRKQQNCKAAQALFGAGVRVFNNDSQQAYSATAGHNHSNHANKMLMSKGNTVQSWHKHQKSMKLSTHGNSNVASPRKYSHQTSLKAGTRHNSKSGQQTSNQILMQNTYITYDKQAVGGHQRAQVGRKSLNLQSTSHRSQKQNQQPHNLGKMLSTQKQSTSVVSHHSHMIVASSDQIKLKSEKATLNFKHGDDERKQELTKNLVMSNEANRQIMTDQEHFGSFMISTTAKSSLGTVNVNANAILASNSLNSNNNDALIPTLPHQKNSSGRNSRTSNSRHRTQTNNTTSPAHRVASTSVIAKGSCSPGVATGSNAATTTIEVAKMGSGEVLSGSQSIKQAVLRHAQSSSFHRMNQFAVQSDDTSNLQQNAITVFLNTEGDAKPETTSISFAIQKGNDRDQKVTVDCNSQELNEVDVPPQLLNSVSPDNFSSSQRRHHHLFGKHEQAYSAQKHDSTVLLQEITRGENKLGRALNRDSALAPHNASRLSANQSQGFNQQQMMSGTGAANAFLENQSANMRSSVMSSAHNHNRSGPNHAAVRPSTKSPLHSKKNAKNHYQQQQKQSLKQLGISYGILAKQDTQNKLVASKNKRGTLAKSKDPAQQLHSHHIQNSPKKNLREKKASYVENIYNISSPPQYIDADGNSSIVLEGSKLISYDEQTELTPIQSQHAIIRNTAHSQGRMSYFGGSLKQATGGKHLGQQQQQMQQLITNSPARFGGSYGHQLRGKANATTTGSVETASMQQNDNQMINKRIPDLQVGLSSLSGPPAFPGNIAFSQNHFLPQTQRGRMFKYQILPGNNAQLVKRVMQETRSYLWAEMLNNQQSHFHFRWSPVSRQINFERLSHNFGQMVNHFEHHHEITTKNELFKNLKSYNDERHQNAFYMIPLTFCLKISAERQNQSIKQQLKPFKEVYKLLEEFKDYCNPDYKPPLPVANQPNEKSQTSQNSSIDQSFVVKPYNQVVSAPQTVLVTKKGREAGYRDITNNAHDDVAARVKKFTSKSSGLVMPMCHFTGQNVWILKPTGFNRGKGIHVVNSIKKLKRLIKEYSRGKESQTCIGGTNSLPTNTSSLYPSSKFMEPQALNTQQMMMATMQAAIMKGQPVPQMPFQGASLSAQKQSKRSLGGHVMTANVSLASSTCTQQPRFITAIKSENQRTSEQISERDENDTFVDTPIKNPNPIKQKSELPLAITSLDKTKSATAARNQMKDYTEGIPEQSSDPSTITRQETTNQVPVEMDKEQARQIIAQSTQSIHPKTAQTVIMQAKVPQQNSAMATASQFTYQKPAIRTQTFIIQKYIERPLLVNQRKFDIRVWVTLTQDNDVYFFREGYLRTSSQPYSMSAQNLDDDFVHLTNNAIQKNSPEYGCHEDGNQLSFADFKKLIQKSGSGVDFDAEILAKMKYLCALTLNTIRKKINPSRRKHCFELFGFDYFIDVDYNVFLIEVNTNPCLEESSRLLAKLLPRMLDDLFKLTIDQIYLPTKDLVQQMQPTLNQIHHGKTEKIGQNYRLMTGKSLYPVEGYKDNFNMWEKIGTLKQTAPAPILATNPFQKQLSRSSRLIHLVNQHEMRVAQPELIEKGIKRDLQLTGSSQLSGFVDY